MLYIPPVLPMDFSGLYLLWIVPCAAGTGKTHDFPCVALELFFLRSSAAVAEQRP